MKTQITTVEGLTGKQQTYITMQVRREHMVAAVASGYPYGKAYEKWNFTDREVAQAIISVADQILTEIKASDERQAAIERGEIKPVVINVPDEDAE